MVLKNQKKMSSLFVVINIILRTLVLWELYIYKFFYFNDFKEMFYFGFGFAESKIHFFLFCFISIYSFFYSIIQKWKYLYVTLLLIYYVEIIIHFKYLNLITILFIVFVDIFLIMKSNKAKLK